MQAAPPVTYPVGRSRFAGVLLLAVWLAGLAVCLLWWSQLQSAGWRLPAAAAAVTVAGAAAGWSWWHSPSGEVVWDGNAWNGAALRPLDAATLEVALDLQGHLFVRCRSGSASRWLWLDGSRDVQRWDDLRRAVYSRARPDATRQALPPAAKT
ncbi:MAG: hypothetical protein ABIR26_15465 [Ramlibacter sp.]